MNHKKLKHGLLLYILGLYLLISVALNLTKNFLQYGDLYDIFWFCNIVAIALGFGILLNNRKAVSISLVASIPAQLLWFIDFFLELFFVGFGRTSFIMNEPFWVIVVTTNLHLIVIPIAIYAVYKMGFAKDILIHIIVMTVLLLTSTFLFTDLNTNRNCVFYPCDETELWGGDDKRNYLEYFLVNSLAFWVLVLVLNYYFISYITDFKRNSHKKIKKS